jgi:hypothetical protein
MKDNIDLIIRGFLYKPNWLPLSTRKRYTGKYTIDFFKYSDFYKKLIQALKTKYNVNLFFSTYDTTPEENLKQICNLFSPVNIFLSPELNSTQFTTVYKALKEPSILNNSNIKLLIRSDILVTPYLINTLLSQSKLNKNILYVLCKEKVNNDKVIDILHLFHGDKILSDLTDYFSIPRKHAHNIHKKIYTKILTHNNAHNCFRTEDCKEFFSIFEGNL